MGLVNAKLGRFGTSATAENFVTTAPMASSSSSTPMSIHHRPKRINDALYEFCKPATTPTEMEIVFFHGFRRQGDDEAYLTDWKLPGHRRSLITLLAEKFPEARISSVSYDSCIRVTDSEARLDMHLIGENLAQSIVGLKGIAENCPVIFVGHCIGGLVLKQVCIEAQDKASTKRINEHSPYRNFLQNMRGAVFYSTANCGSRMQLPCAERERAPLLNYMVLLSPDAARLNAQFANLRREREWRTRGVLGANECVLRHPQTIRRSCWRGKTQASVNGVEEGTARYDMDDFCVLSGLDHNSICTPDDASSSNFQFLESFVQEILEEEIAAKKLWVSTLRPTEFVDMPERVNGVIQELRLVKPPPYGMALFGMGGIGKTILAKEVLIQIGREYEVCCYVEGVKTKLKSHCLGSLIADNLYTGSGRKVHLLSDDVCSIFKKLKGKKVFLIMDDIDSEEQISYLLNPLREEKLLLGAESRLMVTSRTRSRADLPFFSGCEVQFLKDEEAEKMFLSYLGSNDRQRDSRIRKLIPEVVGKCQGLPLSLAVVGRHLRFKETIESWKSALEKLTSAEPVSGRQEDRLWTQLKIMYEDLASPEQDTFLDMVMFDEKFSYYLKDLWERRPGAESSLQNLIDRSLVLPNISEGGRITVYRIHEQLRDFGRSISRPYGRKLKLCRGVWQQNDISNLLGEDMEEQSDVELVLGDVDWTITPYASTTNLWMTPSSFPLSTRLVINEWRKDAVNPPITPSTPVTYSWRSVAQLRRLRFLRLSNIRMIGNESARFPKELAFLHFVSCERAQEHGSRLGDCWPIREKDLEMLESLTVLHMDSCPYIHLPSSFHKLRNLKYLIISGTDSKKPVIRKELGDLSNLRVLIFERVELEQGTESLFKLSSLHTLRLRTCAGIETLSVALQNSGLRSCLKELSLVDLPQLRQLSDPGDFGLLHSLEELAIGSCPALKKLPGSLGQLRKLTALTLVELHIMRIPRSIGQLTKLKILVLDTLRKLSFLPKSMGGLRTLKILVLDTLEKVSSLFETLGGLISLEKLHVRSCDSLGSLPYSIGQLCNLDDLHIHSSKMENLPDSLGQLRQLRTLSIACENLVSIPDTLGLLTALENLRIRECRNLKALPDSLGKLSSLKTLEIHFGHRLRSLPGTLGQLKSLLKLNLTGCRVQELPDSLGELSQLVELELNCCRSLRMLPQSFISLKNLVRLKLVDCTKLESLPERGQFTALEKVEIKGCDKLTQGW